MHSKSQDEKYKAHMIGCLLRNIPGSCHKTFCFIVR